MGNETIKIPTCNKVYEKLVKAKPDIKIMNMVLNELNLLPENCLYVGDNPIDDALCSKQAGMDCAWIATKDRILPSSIPYSEDYRISSIEELPEILLST